MVFIRDKARAARTANELSRSICARYPEYNATVRDFSELRDFNAYPGNGNMDAYIVQVDTCAPNDPGFAIAKRLRQRGLNQCLFAFVTPDADCLLTLTREGFAPVYAFAGEVDKAGIGALAEELVKGVTKRDFVELVYDYRKNLINVRNILYVMASGAHTLFISTSGTFESSERIGDVEKKLPAYFIRVDKGTLLNLNHLAKADYTAHKAEFTEGSFVYMSRRGTKKLFDTVRGKRGEVQEEGDGE
jgi:DNA-binding LytR/AlgR family response regulator